MIFSLLESILLIINAIAILNEKRFLKKCTLGLFQTDSTLYRLSRTVPTKALTPSHRSSWWYSRCAPLESVKVLSCRYSHTFEHCGHFVGTRQLIFCSVFCYPFAILTRFCILSHIFKIQLSNKNRKFSLSFTGLCFEFLFPYYNLYQITINLFVLSVYVRMKKYQNIYKNHALTLLRADVVSSISFLSESSLLFYSARLGSSCSCFWIKW